MKERRVKSWTLAPALLLPFLAVACSGSVEIKRVTFKEATADRVTLIAELDSSLRKEYPEHLFFLVCKVLDQEAGKDSSAAQEQQSEIDERALRRFNAQDGLPQLRSDYQDNPGNEALQRSIDSRIGSFRIISNPDQPPYVYEVTLPLKAPGDSTSNLFKNREQYTLLLRLIGKIPTFGVPAPLLSGHPLESNVTVFVLKMPD